MIWFTQSTVFSSTCQDLRTCLDLICWYCRAGGGQEWRLHCLLDCTEPLVLKEGPLWDIPPWLPGSPDAGNGAMPWCTVDVCLSAQGCQFQHRLVRMTAWLEKRNQSQERDEQCTQRDRGNARPYSQVISAVTGLVQDLLNISHFSNRTIFVGPEKKLRIETWPAGHGREW